MDLEKALAAYAGWQGYARTDRARAWLDRLDVNRPELEAFRAAPVPEAAPYVPLATVVEAARGTAAARVPIRIAAGVALDSARELAALKAFTFLPEDLAPAPRGFLDGAAVAIKDLMAVQGWPLTGGGKAIGAQRPASDAAIVARIRRAGGAIMGL